MLGGVRGPGRTSLLLLTLATLFLVTGIASAALITLYGSPADTSPGVLLVATGPVSILAVLVVVLALSRPEGVEEVFLVHDSGLLLVHFSKTVRPEKDRDIVVGMLTAVQGFIREAFSKGSAQDLRMMDFGDRKIQICKGTYSYLAVLVRGRAPLGLAKRMRRTLERVERQYREAIAKWNGSAEGLAGADDLLLEGLLGDELRQVAAQARVTAAKVIRVLTRQRIRAEPRIPPARTTQTDPRVAARKLLARPELEEFRPEYCEMMHTALQELVEGRFTLAGLGNLYMTMAMQKNPRSTAVGWWELMLRTVRGALRTWPWDPEIQAWVMPEAPPVSERVPAPSPAPTPAPALEPSAHVAIGAPNPPAAAEHTADSA